MDRSIRGVVERAQRAADNHEGLEDYDINVLKLLYLTLHIDDIPSTIDNLTILMADTINVDKIALKAKVSDSLERLLAQNYISYYSGVYKFLTDDEQQVAREIRNTDVNSSEIVNKIGSIIYDSIFEGKKFRYDNNDYEFNRFIDNQSYSVGSVPNGMRLTFITVAYDIDSSFDKTAIKSDSKSLKSATCILSDTNTNYYQDVEKALKISKYINKKNVNSLSDQIQDIIKRQNIEATNLLNKAKEEIADAIVDGEWLIYGENETVNGGTASSKINNALNKLIEEVYDNHYMLNKHYASEEEIASILKSENPISEDINQEALNSIYRYIQMQFRKNITLTIKDILDRYTFMPYGWKEIDIVGLMTVLIKNQKINIERNGSKVDTNNPNMITYLRKRTEIVSTKVIFRESLDEKLLRYSRNFMRKYFDIMSVPEDEDSLVKYIIDNFTAKRDELYNLRKIYYNNYAYPGQNVVDDGIELIGSILKKAGDHKTFLESIKSLEDDLYDFKEDIEDVDEFFDNQVKLFDNARKLYNSLQDEQMYFISNVILTTALSDISNVITIKDPYNYSRISRLNNYIATINEEYSNLLKVKRKELSELIDQCNEIIETYKNDKPGCDTIIYNTQTKYDFINKSLTSYKKVLRIEQEKDNVLNLKDKTIKEINKLKSSVIKDKSVPYNAVEPEIVDDTASKKKIVEYQRNVIFRNGVTLTSEQQVDNYLKEAKDYLMKIIDKNGGVKIE
ncbi:MAG: BREX system P-loop protein BrxC [Erysipelotrichaceae bacterium]|nr:BREX system P-loop protein BrxC [Erysipelotrichaceae bacterium]